jgi:NAD-dependent SIR2 family protein deacetylase
MELFERLNIIPGRGLHVVALTLTGAGISAESGVPIFRGKGSMWENLMARKLASKAGPPWNTRGTWEFYDLNATLSTHRTPALPV